MKFEVILEDLLNELTGKEIYQKYYSKMNYDFFLDIVSTDPQTELEGKEIKRLGKYSKMLINLYQKGGLLIEDLDKAKEYLEYVYKHKIPLDINKIKYLSDLYDVVKGYIAQDTKSLDEILKILSKEEYKVLLNGDKWYIFQPLTERASCYLGVDTEWCTTWGPYSLNKKHRDRGNHFNSHSVKGPLFIMINKENLNDKYQFHFETNQFMDRSDRRINTSIFFKNSDRSEILNYFFPSFTREVSGDEMKIELKRMDVLPDELGLQILEKSYGKIDNKLINALFSKNEEQIKSVFNVEVTLNDNGKLVFELDTLSDDMEQLEQNISWYEYEINNGWQFVYDDVRDRGLDDDYDREKLETFLEKYYENNKEQFLQIFSVKDFETFLKLFFENYIKNDGIADAYFTDVADLSYSSYEESNENIVNSIKQDIEIESNYNSNYDITVDTTKFIQFLIKKDISEVSDEVKLALIIDDFIDYCGHGGDFERVYDFDYNYPKYGEKNYLTSETDKYFDKVLENAEDNRECIELRKKLNIILDKYFKGSMYYENDHIVVRLKSTEIDCLKGTIKLEYKNKDTGEKFGSLSKPDNVKVDNLASLMMNYKLFESYIKFNKNIIK